MIRFLLLHMFLGLSIICYSQNSHLFLTSSYQPIKQYVFQSTEPNYIELCNGSGMISKERHLRTGQRLCVIGSLAFLVAAELANSNSNKNLATGFVSAGLVTSSVGLVWYLRDQKKKK